MAKLEYIRYQPHRPVVRSDNVTWLPDSSIKPLERLPQIFWNDGRPWNEANVWALEMGRNRDLKSKTVHSLMEHLHKYANWLESTAIDWRHFPINKAERVLVRFRGVLIDQRDRGELTPSTTSARMRAVIRFYRYCSGHNLVSRDTPKWRDKEVIVHYFNSEGFLRTMQRITTDISIPNRSRKGVTLEDGLLPITQKHMQELLRFTQDNASKELHLMLLTGFFTGARLGTITTLRVHSIEQAVCDPMAPGMWVIPIGPGTGVSTKFDVSGDLLVPDELMVLLKDYAGSTRHTDRVIKARREDKLYLFLTRYGKPFSSSAVNTEMVKLRRGAMAAGLKFMQRFKFHQSRATFGTWLTSICIRAASVKLAIEFVRRAMHHEHESTTFRYITFIEHTKAKIEVSNAFTEAFLGTARSHMNEASDA